MVEEGTRRGGTEGTDEAVGEAEDETCLAVRRGRTEVGKRAAVDEGDHGPDGVDDGAKEEGTGDVLFFEEEQGRKKASGPWNCRLGSGLVMGARRQWRAESEKGGRWIPVSRTVPFPAMERRVSGEKGQ